MKHWLFLATALACLWGCSDETSQNTSTAASTGAGGSSSSSSSSSASGGAGGEQPMALGSCLDEVNALPRPPSGKLPCEYIPPGLTLP